MIKEYAFSDILPHSHNQTLFYIRHFCTDENEEIEWPHSHSFFSYVWFTHGGGCYVIDAEEYEIRPQRVFCVAPKQVHNWNLFDGVRGYIIAIHPLAELPLNYAFPYIDISDADALLHMLIIEKSREQLKQNHPSAQENIGSALDYYSRLLAEIARSKHIKTRQTNALIEQFKQLILANYSETRAIGNYAEKLNIHPLQLNRACKTHLGISAKQYLLNLKITEAKRLLVYSDLNVSETAYRIGMED